jgi:hypothetical protein
VHFRVGNSCRRSRFERAWDKLTQQFAPLTSTTAAWSDNPGTSAWARKACDDVAGDMPRTCGRPARRDGETLNQPSSRSPGGISVGCSRTTKAPGGAPPDPIDERVPLEALPASTSLIVLHSCPFVRFVTANNATCRCAKDAMVTSEMARSTTHHSTF